jgi:hypothetical protein
VAIAAVAARVVRLVRVMGAVLSWFGLGGRRPVADDEPTKGRSRPVQAPPPVWSRVWSREALESTDIVRCAG